MLDFDSWTPPASSVEMPQVNSGRISEIAEQVAELGGKRVLIVSGPSRRFVPELSQALSEYVVSVFDGARRHVPRVTVEDAERALVEAKADTLVSLGGGSATGLVKALRLRHDFKFIAIPTTYAGSEMTNLYGTTHDGQKVTGRDHRVRPDRVIYDAELTREMPLTLTITSLCNALAHPLSALAAQAELAADARPDPNPSLDVAANLYQIIETLLRWPGQSEARSAALLWSGRAALCLQGALGLQHRLAHSLGGHFDVDHSALHAVLLPHTTSLLRQVYPDVIERLSTSLGVDDLEASLYGFLERAVAPTGLRNLAISYEAFSAFSAAQYASAADDDDDAVLNKRRAREVLSAAYQARRPSRHTTRVDWGLREPVSLRGASLERAERVIVALHGRGSNADSIVRRYVEIAGEPRVECVIAPQAPNNSWSAQRQFEPRAAHGAELVTSLAECEGLIARVRAASNAPIVLFGFSQGACFALEVLARSRQPFAAVVALSGSAIGGQAEPPKFSDAVRGTPVLIGASEADSWVDPSALAFTRDLLERAGANLSFELVPGDAHAFHARHRLLARRLLTGKAPLPAATGLYNSHEVELLPGALPRNQNTPRQTAYGLYPEQLNVTGFTAPRNANRRAWFYRIRPSATQGRFKPLSHPTFDTAFVTQPAEPDLAGLAPLPAPTRPTDFIDGIWTLGGAGSAAMRRGYAIHLYSANRNMEDRAFCNADGDLLILPEQGTLTLLTEFGTLEVAPGWVALVPRGVRFSVILNQSSARGYMAEVYGRAFTLPERGPIGANGLTDARHFEAPTPWYEDRLAIGYRIVHKLSGTLFETTTDYSPYDVVAWHGNTPPYRYDLSHFSPVSTSRIDHIDPSVYTVLGAPLDETGTDSLDFVIFPPRWDVSEHTFRPPFFHRNVTTEINGIVRESPHAKAPFVPGCVFITPSMTPHGVRAESVERALSKDQGPHRFGNHALWFQFETALPFSLSPWVKQSAQWLADWPETWGAYRTHFRKEA